MEKRKEPIVKLLTKVPLSSIVIADQTKRDRMANLVREMKSNRHHRNIGTLSSQQLRSQGFCPLGLACHFSGYGHWEKKPGFSKAFVLNSNKSVWGLIPPPIVISYYGFRSHLESGNTPGSFYLNRQNELRWLAIAFMNDTLKLPLSVIAICLEKTYLTGWDFSQKKTTKSIDRERRNC